MRYTDLQCLSATEFKRLCGVSRDTFADMALSATSTFVTLLSSRWAEQTECGRPVASGARVLARSRRRSGSGEYRSQFHIATSWGLHETTVGRLIRKVEDLQVLCSKFRLPSKRYLYQPAREWKVMMVDVSEMEIERPKKNRNVTTAASKNATH